MSVTARGFAEARAAIEKLPEMVTARLKAVARQSAQRVAKNGATNLLAKSRAVKTAASIVVIDESQEKRFIVSVPGHPDDPRNLPLWLERGTRFMAARPFMRPALDAEHPRYVSEMGEAATSAAKDALT